MCFKPGVTRPSDYFCAVNRRGVEGTSIALLRANSNCYGWFAATALENAAKNRKGFCGVACSFVDGSHQRREYDGN